MITDTWGFFDNFDIVKNRGQKTNDRNIEVGSGNAASGPEGSRKKDKMRNFNSEVVKATIYITFACSFCLDPSTLYLLPYTFFLYPFTSILFPLPHSDFQLQIILSICCNLSFSLLADIGIEVFSSWAKTDTLYSSSIQK